MATYSDFSSLLQLGVGTGIGLSLFRAPVDLRVARISRTLEGEIAALRAVSTDFAKRKRRALQELKVKLAGQRRELDQLMFPVMVLAVGGALWNLLLLVGAALCGPLVLVAWAVAGLIIGSVVYFLLLVIVLEFVARIHLGPIDRQMKEILRTQAVSPGAGS